MPTFSTISIHPILQQRLQSKNQNHHSSEEDHPHPHPQPHRHLHDPNAATIGTPLALLCRTREQVLQALGIPPDDDVTAKVHVDRLRHQIAHAMIAQSRTGRYQLSVQSLDAAIREDADQQSSSSSLSLSPLIPGATRSLWHSLTCPQRQSSISCYLSTGCQVLNDFIARPSSLTKSWDDFYRHLQRHGAQRQPNNDDTTTRLPLTGIPMGHVLQLSGGMGCGKTQLACQIAATTVATGTPHEDREVVYLASSAGHCITAIAQRLQTFLGTSTVGRDQIYHQLSKIQIQPISEMQELVIALAHIEDRLLQELQEQSMIGPITTTTTTTTTDHHQHSAPDDSKKRLQLVVIDSISGIVWGESDDYDDETIASIGRWCKRLTQLYSIVIVMTHGVNGTGSTALGKQWNSFVDIHLALSRPDQPSLPEFHFNHTNGLIRATLLDHPTEGCTPERKELSLDLIITPLGVTTPVVDG